MIPAISSRYLYLQRPHLLKNTLKTLQYIHGYIYYKTGFGESSDGRIYRLQTITLRIKIIISLYFYLIEYQVVLYTQDQRRNHGFRRNIVFPKLDWKGNTNSPRFDMNYKMIRTLHVLKRTWYVFL